jgi:hypothetical protein
VPVASVPVNLPARAPGHAVALADRQARVRCGDAQYGPSLLQTGYRTILGVVRLPPATRNSSVTRYVIGGGTPFQRRFPFAVSLNVFVLAGTTPITLSVPAAWAARELLTTNLQRTSQSAKGFTSIRFDACPEYVGFHPQLIYPFTILMQRSGCYPLSVQVGSRRARISLDLSVKLARSCRPPPRAEDPDGGRSGSRAARGR